MLDQPPIFLGGQGGLVGPARIEYGTIIPAGMICRQDVPGGNQLFVPPPVASANPPRYVPGLYRDIHRIVSNNLAYIGNLQALESWYRHARGRFMSGDDFAKACRTGAIDRIKAGIRERIKRLGELAQKMPHSLEAAGAEGGLPRPFRLRQEALIRQWPEMEQALGLGPSDAVAAKEREIFLAQWNTISPPTPYLEAVRQLSAESRAAGTAWLQAIVDRAAALWSEV
jgi:UDP-N-acetylglucosamine/UDP-N-acetylgalactosamine diphosphorylase